MTTRTWMGIVMTAFGVLPSTAWAQSGELTIVRSTFAPSATSRNGGLVLRGTIGQADATAEPLTNGGLTLNGGFWVPISIVTLRGDADRDGDVDVADYLQLVECFAGPATPIASDCDVFDFNGDGDVDLADFVAFQAAFTGSR